MSSSLHLACILTTPSQTKSLLSTSTPTLQTKPTFSSLPCKLRASHIPPKQSFHRHAAITSSTTDVLTSSETTLTNDQWAAQRETLLQQIQQVIVKVQQLFSEEATNGNKRPLLQSTLQEFYALGNKIFELEPQNSIQNPSFITKGLMDLGRKTEVPATLIDADGVEPIDPHPNPGQGSQVVDQFVEGVAKAYWGSALTKPNPYLTGNFAPIRQETPPTSTLEIVGEIPKSLNGMMLRNGPDPKYDPEALYSWMDGDSMIHGIRFEDGNATYVSRYAGTSRYVQEGDFQRSEIFKFGDLEGEYGMFALSVQFLRSKFEILDMCYGFTNSNTGLVCHGGRIMALEDFGKPNALYVDDNGDIQSIGINNYDGVLDHWFTPHPKKDPVTGEMFAFGSMYTEPYCIYNVINKDGSMGSPVTITVRGPTYMHDLGLTEKYVIFMDLPYVFSPETMKDKDEWIYSLDVTKKPRFGILPRYATSEEGIKWFEFTNDVPFFIFHNGNAWEDENGDIVMYSAVMDPQISPDGTSIYLAPAISRRKAVTNDDDEVKLTLPKMNKLTFNMSTGVPSRESITDTVIDYPKINESYMGRKTQYIYASEVNGEHGKITSIVKYDLNATDNGGEVETKLEFEEGIYGNEVVFTPKSDSPTSEDDGYLITFVHNENIGKSYTYVIDALTMKIVSTIGLPNRVPYGFHAIYVTEEELQAQKMPSSKIISTQKLGS